MMSLRRYPLRSTENKMNIEEPSIASTTTRQNRKKRVRDAQEALTITKDSKHHKSLEKNDRPKKPIIDVDYTNLISEILKHRDNKKTILEHTEFLQKYLHDFGNTMMWPARNRSIQINLEKKGRFTFITISDKSVPITSVTIKIDQNHFEVSKATIISDAQKDAVKDWIYLINFIYNMNITYSDECSTLATSEDLHAPEAWLDNVDELDQIGKKYQHTHFSLPHFLMYHTNHLKNEYEAWISKEIPAQPNLFYRLSFTTFKFPKKIDPKFYHSWMFKKNEFDKMNNLEGVISEENMRLQIFEDYPSQTTESKKKPIGDIWFNSSCAYGEVRDIQNGRFTSGNEIMTIIHKISDNILDLPNLNLCDASRKLKESEVADGQVVFRILKAVAYGKTWYQQFGYEPMTFENVVAGYAVSRADRTKRTSDISEETKEILLNQNAAQYESDLDRIREIPIDNLYQYFLDLEKKSHIEKSKKEDMVIDQVISKSTPIKIKKEKRSIVLHKLCQKYLRYDNSDSESIHDEYHLKDLAKMICDKEHNIRHNKNATDFERTEIEKDISDIYRLLILPKRFTNNYTPPKSEANAKPFHDLLHTLVFTMFYSRENNNPHMPKDEKENITQLKSNKI